MRLTMVAVTSPPRMTTTADRTTSFPSTGAGPTRGNNARAVATAVVTIGATRSRAPLKTRAGRKGPPSSRSVCR